MKMKKLIFAFAMFGAMFASCGNSTNSANTDKDSVDTVQVDTLNADTASVDTTVCMD